MELLIRLEQADRIKREEIEEKINTLRGSAKVKRFDRIAVLKEAAGIAHSLKIKEAIGYKLQKINDSLSNSSQVLTDISEKEPQLYSRGYEALEAEILSLSSRKTDDSFIPTIRGLQDQLKLLANNEVITILKTRNNDDPFIPELRGLQQKLKQLAHNRKAEQLKNRVNDDPFIKSLRDKEAELARLGNIHIDPKTVKVAHLVRAAYPSKRRIKPKRLKIVMMGLVIGLILGVFISFFWNFLENERINQQELERL